MIPTVTSPTLYHKRGVNPPFFGVGVASMGAVSFQIPAQQLLSNGLVEVDEPMMQQALSQGAALLPALESHILLQAQALTQPRVAMPTLLKTVAVLQLAERLADRGVSMDSLYPALSRLDSVWHPLVTIYLAGVYSKLNRPEPFGWAMMTLARLGVEQAQGTLSAPHLQKAHEEVGKVVSFQLQKFPGLSAQLGPWLSTFAPQRQISL